MCTVTYIPREEGSFILSSNRDENPARSPQNLTREQSKEHTLIFPRDTSAGGSWIAAEGDNRVVCLLNGAFEKHSHRPPYKRSRGVMVLDYFNYKHPAEFAEKYDFEEMEPFTLVMPHKDQLFELRWDEKRVHFRELDAKDFHIWSSATLYPEPIRKKRAGWFKNWLQGRTDFSLNAIHDLHRTGGEGDIWNDYIMNRNGVVQTVSITHIVKTSKSLEFIYHDLLRERTLMEYTRLEESSREP